MTTAFNVPSLVRGVRVGFGFVWFVSGVLHSHHDDSRYQDAYEKVIKDIGSRSVIAVEKKEL